MATGADVVALASKFIGKLPYHFGASASSTSMGVSADCSSFVQFIYGLVGVHLSRTADKQYKDTQSNTVSKDALQPGDLLFFGGYNTPGNPAGYGGVQHVGIYAGNGNVIDEGGANPNNVGTAPLSAYGNHFIAATRPLAPGLGVTHGTITVPFGDWFREKMPSGIVIGQVLDQNLINKWEQGNNITGGAATAAALGTLLAPYMGKKLSALPAEITLNLPTSDLYTGNVPGPDLNPIDALASAAAAIGSLGDNLVKIATYGFALIIVLAGIWIWGKSGTAHVQQVDMTPTVPSDTAAIAEGTNA